jgi:ubiquinone/menaquinone biosynthesis C-methylase UbiE
MIKRRTIKENALRNEVAKIRRMKGQKPYKNEMAVRILGSSDIAKAILRKAGYIPEPTDSHNSGRMPTRPMYSRKEVINTLDENYMTEYLIRAQKAEKEVLKKEIGDLSKQLGRRLMVLDIGIGDARVPRILSGVKKVWNMVEEYDGIDNSEEMLRMANSTITQYELGNKVKTYYLDAKDLPQLNKVYELILCTYFTPCNLDKNKKFKQIFHSAYSMLVNGGKIVLGSIYLDNESTRKKQEEFYENCGMKIISKPTDKFTATEEGMWSERLTPDRIRKRFDWIDSKYIEIRPIDKYNFAVSAIITKKPYSVTEWLANTLLKTFNY